MLTRYNYKLNLIEISPQSPETHMDKPVCMSECTKSRNVTSCLVPGKLFVLSEKNYFWWANGVLVKVCL